MLFGHLGDVVGQAHILSVARVAGRGKAQKLGDFFTIGEVFDRAFLEHVTEVLPEDRIFFLVFRELAEHAEHAFGQRTLELLRHSAFLQQFAGNVKRQIVRVNQTADEAQIVGQELFGFVHDEDALHEKLQAMYLVAGVQIPRSAGRYIEQRRVFEFTFDAVVRPGKRILKVVTQVLIELLVLLFGHFSGIHGPKRLGVVDLHPIPGARRLVFAFLGSFVLFFPEHHRHGDVIGILGDGGAHRPGFEEFFAIGLEVQRDARTAGFTRDGLARVSAFTRAFPANGFVCGGLGGTRFHRHLVGHDEGRVEAHAELTDQLAVLCLIPGEVAQEVCRAALGDRAQMQIGFFERHADAVVRHGKRLGVLVDLHSDAESRIVTQQRRIGDGKEAQLIDGVAGVGNDFTQEHFLVGIQGLGKQGQKLGDFGLKTMDFSSHFLFHLLNQKFTKPLQKRRSKRRFTLLRYVGTEATFFKTRRQQKTRKQHCGRSGLRFRISLIIQLPEAFLPFPCERGSPLRRRPLRSNGTERRELPERGNCRPFSWYHREP